MLEQGEPTISYSDGEMREVINDEGQHNQPAHHHVTRGKRGLHVLSVDVSLRPGAPVFEGQLDRHVNVSDDS